MINIILCKYLLFPNFSHCLESADILELKLRNGKIQEIRIRVNFSLTYEQATDWSVDVVGD